jgi:exodeoxyribonuclease V alpha subunit
LLIVVPLNPRDQPPSLFPEKETLTIEGTLRRIRFASDDDAWSVVVLSLSDTGREVTAVGNLSGVQVGETLRLTGTWTTHSRFGEQFQVSSFTAVTPATVAGIERYLGSGLVPGVGREIASRLVRKFGAETLHVIDAQPTRLREVEGIGPVRARQIQGAWKKQRELREVMIFPQSCGISTILASRIYGLYGAAAASSIRANPWGLAADVPGIGFRTADAVARNLGVAPDSPHRTEAGLLFFLEQEAEEGNTWARRELLVASAAQLLGREPSACDSAGDSLARRQAVVVARDPVAGELVALRSLAEKEADAARRLALLASGPSFGDESPGAAEDPVLIEKESSPVLSELQKTAVREALRSKILVITGGPGTGKTTLITAIVRILAQRGARVALCAPTGRAAKRMGEAVGRESLTIHRLLEWSPQKGGFMRDEHSPLPCDALIVDETSMVDIALFSRLLAAVPPRARLILVGDSDQLPSVGPGNVLADLISCKKFPVVRLTEIFRQAETSSIVVNAHRINAGLMPNVSPSKEGDFFFIEREEPDAILSMIRELVASRIPQRFSLDPRADIQVLTPMRKGPLGVTSLNQELQTVLNPCGPEIAWGAARFRRGDRVMQVQNNYELGVFNGDIGLIEEIDETEKIVGVRYEERTVRYAWADLDQLSLSYACSIHKSQGSEFPAVVIVLHAQHFVLLKRNLLYTAVTRARSLAVLVGSRRALAMAVKNAGTKARTTRLASLIAAASAGKGAS